jgi:hypothetical protein
MKFLVSPIDGAGPRGHYYLTVSAQTNQLRVAPAPEHCIKGNCYEILKIYFAMGLFGNGLQHFCVLFDCFQCYYYHLLLHSFLRWALS